MDDGGFGSDGNAFCFVPGVILNIDMYFKDTYVLILSYKADITSFDEYRASSGCIKALSRLGDLEIEWSLASHLGVC